MTELRLRSPFVELALCAGILLPLIATPSGAAEGGRTSPIVFIHGIKGSRLTSNTGETQWITIWNALGLRTPTLALPLTWDPDGAQGRDDTTATGVLDEVAIVPRLFTSQIYGPYLRSMPEPFYPFAYDWRRDNLETVEKFEGFLGEIRARHPNKKIQLVSHSMGGLISWVVLNRHPDWFSHVVFAGVPFVGGVSFLPDLSTGTREGLNGRILSPAVLGTFPSTYVFFAASGKGLAGAKFFSADFWEERKWGIFSEDIAAQHKDNARKYLRAALARAEQMRSLLVRAPVAYPSLYVLRSRATPTLFDFPTGATCAGDGRVCADGAVPPDGVPATVVEVSSVHAAILNDPKAIALIRSFD